MRLTTAALTVVCTLIAGGIVLTHELPGRFKGDSPQVTMQTTDAAGISIEDRLTPITGPRDLGRPAIGMVGVASIRAHGEVLSDDDALVQAATDHQRMLHEARIANHDRSTERVRDLFPHHERSRSRTVTSRLTFSPQKSLFDESGSIFEGSQRYSMYGSTFNGINTRLANARAKGARAEARQASQIRDGR